MTHGSRLFLATTGLFFALIAVLAINAVGVQAFRRNMISLYLVKLEGRAGSEIDLDRLVQGPEDHLFRDLTRSHLLASRADWVEASISCDVAWTKVSDWRSSSRPPFIESLCQARHAASQGDWWSSARFLDAAWTYQPAIQPFIQNELRLVLGNETLDQWKATGSPISKCLAQSYLGSEVAAEQNHEGPDTDCQATKISGLLQLPDGNGCITVNPWQLEFPGEALITVAAQACSDQNAIEGVHPVVTMNIVGNGGFVLPNDSGPALGVTSYYDDGTDYDLLSTVAVDAGSKRRYLAVAPMRNLRPDTLTNGRFVVRPDRWYLVGGIGRTPPDANIEVGCTWWGGPKHGSFDGINIHGSSWTLGAALIMPPTGAHRCVLSFYNDNSTQRVDLDSVFLAEVDNSIVQSLLDVPITQAD